MTEALRATPYGAYHHQEDPRRSSTTAVTDEGLSTKKTMVVLVIVVGCFAVLWPKIFYPMLVNNANSQMKPGPVDKTTGCCDVISEMDVDTLKIMSELCSTIIDTTTGTTPPTSKEILTRCRKAVLETCGIDISAALQDRVSLGHSVKQILEEVRSLNGSLCLKYNFGLSPWRLGVPHRVNIHLDATIKQERPSHLRSDMVHPAFKERGRAIPQPDPAPVPRRPTTTPPKIVEGRPGPIPGMRPAMGGPGHVVPPSKQTNYGVMGVLMPIYTVGFVVFFTYTVMKLVFKRKTEAYVGAPLYPPCEPDERFHKDVFEASQNYFHRPNKDTSKIVVNAVSALLEEVNQELEARKVKTPETVHEQDEIKANGSLPKDDEQGTVKVMGMETTASVESGKKWSRPDSPVLPHPHPVVPKEPSPPPQQIFLEGALPPQSQILVSDSATEAQKDSEDDSPVVLAGKMTLSVISLDSETGTEESSNSVKKIETSSDEERRTSSSNVSEEFEKVNAADLEDQIDNIIEEAENIALTEENRFSLGEELDKFTEEIPKTPVINEKDRDSDVLEEIKNQLNLEDDLLQALKEKEPEGKVSLPVTDIIKEFLNNEENALFEEKTEIKLDHISSVDGDSFKRDKRSLSEEKEEQETIAVGENGLTKEDLELLERQEELEDSIFTKEDLEMVENQQDESTNEDVVVESRNEEDITDKNIESLERQEQSLTKATSEEKEDSAFVKEELELLKRQQEYLLTKEDHISKPFEEEIKAENHKEVEDIVADSINNEEESRAQDQAEDKLSLTETITDMESSDNNLRSSFSIIDESRKSSEEIQGCETTPDLSNGNNKADLLLQGLLVKEDKQLNEGGSEEVSTDQKEDVALDEADPYLAEEEIGEEESEELNEIERASGREREDRNFRVIDAEEALIDDEDYDDSEDDDPVDDEVRDINREVYEDHRESIERRLNGDNADSSRNGAADSETAAVNEISEDENSENEEDEEIEEIIEYVDNTDDEGEEVVEINGNDENRRN